MSSLPLPSAPLAARLGWLAAEARAEKAEAGLIAAALIEVFARLLTCLARLTSRLEAGTLPEPRATLPSAARALGAAPGLLPRVFGWLGGLLPIGGAIALPHRMTLPRAQAGSEFRQAPAQPRAETFAERPDHLRSTDIDADAAASDAGGNRRHLTPRPRPACTWVRVLPATWRRLPAPTAGPVFRIDGLSGLPITSYLLRYRNG